MAGWPHLLLVCGRRQEACEENQTMTDSVICLGRDTTAGPCSLSGSTSKSEAPAFLRQRSLRASNKSVLKLLYICTEGMQILLVTQSAH
jgi:hypothetical protein